MARTDRNDQFDNLTVTTRLTPRGDTALDPTSSGLTDGGTIDSATATLRGYYDSDGTTGVTATSVDATLQHVAAADGSSTLDLRVQGTNVVQAASSGTVTFPAGDLSDGTNTLYDATNTRIGSNLVDATSIDQSIAPTWSGSHTFTNAPDVFYWENDLNALGYPGHGWTSTDTSGTYADVRIHRFNDNVQITNLTAGAKMLRLKTNGVAQFEGALDVEGNRIYQSSPGRLQAPAGPLSVAPKSAAPTGAQNGDIQYADGTNWNPGSGAGFYGYEEGVWVKL